MFKVLNPIMNIIDYNPIEADHNLWGIVSPADKYLACHNAKFAVPAIRSLSGTTIPKDAPNAILHKAEVEHTVHRYDRV